MERIILLNHNENTRLVEEEERYKYIRSILESLGIGLDFWEDTIPSVEVLVKLRDTIAAYNIIILDDQDGGLMIYVDDEKVAEWFKPRYILRQDHSAIDPRKRLYLEMHTESSSIFDQDD